jgi:hypothetical protein
MFRQLAAAGLTVFLAAPAMASSCADRDTVVERLQTYYDESFTAAGIQEQEDSQTLVEVWASEETGTFTVMLTRPDGVTCVVATGTDWHFQPPVLQVGDTAS